MKHIFLFLLTFLLSQGALSQGTFFIGNKSYPCTETFRLASPEAIGGKKLDILIAKNGENEGFIVLSYKTYSQEKIAGNIRILLTDNSFITCVDRGLGDYINHTYTKVYKLTEGELTRLSEINVNSIRFTLKNYDGFSTSKEDFSVINYESDENPFYTEIDIPAKVTNLIQNY